MVCSAFIFIQFGDKMNSMKKLFGLGAVGLMSLGLVACGSSDNQQDVGSIASSGNSAISSGSPTSLPTPSASESSTPIVTEQGGADRSPEEQSAYQRFMELNDISRSVIEKNTVQSDIVGPYFNGDSRGVAIVTLLTVGAKISSVTVEDDSSMTVTVIDDQGELLATVKGFWYPDGRYMTFSSIEETQASQEFRQAHAEELMAIWATNGGS